MTEPMTETRAQHCERKRTEACGIEQFRDHIGNPAPLADDSAGGLSTEEGNELSHPANLLTEIKLIS